MRRRLAAASILLLMLVSCGGRKILLTRHRSDNVVTHRVVYGETWESISRDFYGEEERAGSLASYNGESSSSTPRPGSGVRIPLSAGDIRRMNKKLDAASLYNEGLDLALRGDYGEAVERFEHAVEIDPSFSDASFNLGVTYQKLGLHDKAASVLRELTGSAPGNPAYLYALGNSLFHLGKYEAAREVFADVLDVDPGHIKSIFSLAVACEKAGRTEEAERRFREYLEHDPEGEWAEEAKARLESLVRGGGGTP